jgi:hypothetical protein
MLIYRGELVSGPAALPRLLLRDLIHEKVLVGPVVPDFHGDVCRLIKLPTGGLRVELTSRSMIPTSIWMSSRTRSKSLRA